MTKLKFLVSLLLALGLVACNGDEDETDGRLCSQGWIQSQTLLNQVVSWHSLPC